MEINKITFENSRNLGISQSFEDLDINNDGVINNKDATATKDVNLSKVITNLLVEVDEEGELSEIGELDYTDELTKTSKTNTEETTELSEEDKAKLNSLKKELKTLNANIEKLNAEINKLADKNEQLEKEKEKIEKEQKEAQAIADEKAEILRAEQKKLEMYSLEYDDYQDKLDDLNADILREQGRAEEEYNDSMTNLVNKAINAYNPAEHGDDFNAYFAKKMNEQGYPTFAVLDNLNFAAKNISNKASDVLFNIRSQSSIVASAKSAADAANTTLTSITDKLNNAIMGINSNNSHIKNLQATIKTKETRKEEAIKESNKIQPPVPGAGLSASEVLSLISEKEKCFAKKLGWDLTECVIALGQDNQFHIYNSFEYTDHRGLKRKCDYPLLMSSVRAYFAKTEGNEYSEESISIMPSASGFLWIENPSLPEDVGGKPIYRFSCVNEDWTDGEICESAGCYQTGSPLSFDINGDGIQTKENTINYDIDADGELDIINDSADWVLAFDKDKDGIVGKDGSELFGNNTDLDGDGVKDGYKDGFEVLKALAKKEGLISENDTKLDAADIELLSKKYGLTMKQGYLGETKDLADLGITEINLAETDETKLEKNFDGRHNDIMTQEGATFVVNGQTRDYADIWNAMKYKHEYRSEKSKIKIEHYNLITANIQKTNVNLHLNKDGILALDGDIDTKSIKNSAINKTEAPTNIFEEIIEVKEDEKEI